MYRMMLVSIPFLAHGAYATPVFDNGAPDFETLAHRWLKKNPVRLEGSPKPKMVGGGVSLNEPELAQSALATFLVTPAH